MYIYIRIHIYDIYLYIYVYYAILHIYIFTYILYLPTLDLVSKPSEMGYESFFHLAFFCEKGGVAEGLELLLEKQCLLGSSSHLHLEASIHLVHLQLTNYIIPNSTD